MEKILLISIPLIYEENEHGRTVCTEPQTWEIDTTKSQSAVLVGANGAGKTRLGVFIGQQLHDDNHPKKMISAQRGITFKNNAGPFKLETEQHSLRNFDSRPNFPLRDFDIVLRVLFAEQYELSVRENQERANNPDNKRAIPKLERVANIWGELLPRRKLVIGVGDIKVDIPNNENPEYSGYELSDGERVMLYLISQAILAESDSVLIIDEPELHIHKAILSTLWDKLEKERPDIFFIYITHDLEFAASRGSTKILAVEEFDFTTMCWKITEPTDNADLPEPILLKILGSRKNIIFTEGENGKDAQIVRLLFPDRTIVERGSCGNVINTVSAFQSNETLHHKSCKGIIDRDGRSDEECAFLSGAGIIILPVSEIENLFLVPSIWEEILKSRQYAGEKLAEKIESTKSRIVELATNDLDAYAVRATKRTLDEKLKKIGLVNRTDITALTKEWDDKIRRLNLGDIAIEKKAVLQRSIDDQDIEKILRHYDNKGMLTNCVSDSLGQNYSSFFDETIRVLKSPEGAVIIEKMKAAIPRID